MWSLVINIMKAVMGLWKTNDTATPTISNRAPTALERRQELLGHHVRLVARGMSNGLAVYGSRGGLGKTKTILATLKEEGITKVIYAREAGVEWRELVASQLHEIGRTAIVKVSHARDYDLECLRQVLDDYPDDVGSQESAWCELTHRSRATFYRLKKTLIKKVSSEPDGTLIAAQSTEVSHEGV